MSQTDKKISAPAPAADSLRSLKFGADGLLPVVAQCAASGDVLMLAWMNRAALEATLAGGEMVYFSRSRGELWRKGATSGNVQLVRSLRADCDRDAILAVVEQTGAGACHTGAWSCFFNKLK